MSGRDERLKTAKEIESERRISLLTCEECGCKEWDVSYEYSSTGFYDAEEDSYSESGVEYVDSNGWYCSRCGADSTYEQDNILNARVRY